MPREIPHHQAASMAAGLFHVATANYNGSLASAFLAADIPHGWRPEGDGRASEMRAFREAEKVLLRALSTYDRTRWAALGRLKTD